MSVEGRGELNGLNLVELSEYLTHPGNQSYLKSVRGSTFPNKHRKRSGWLAVWIGTHIHGKLRKEQQSMHKLNVKFSLWAQRNHSVRNQAHRSFVPPGRDSPLTQGGALHPKLQRDKSVGDAWVTGAFQTTDTDFHAPHGSDEQCERIGGASMNNYGDPTTFNYGTAVPNQVELFYSSTQQLNIFYTSFWNRGNRAQIRGDLKLFSQFLTKQAIHLRLGCPNTTVQVTHTSASRNVSANKCQ